MKTAGIVSIRKHQFLIVTAPIRPGCGSCPFLQSFGRTSNALSLSRRSSVPNFSSPQRKGKMATRNLDLAGMTKRALVRAGIIDHWDPRCRRKDCGYVEHRP